MKMNKLLISASLMLTTTVAGARTLTPDEALKRLEGENVPVRAATLSGDSHRLVRTVKSNDGAPAVYLFANKGESGYLVVSADDVAMPLLGYSDNATLDSDGTLPPQMQWWLEQYALEIESAKKNEDAPVYIPTSLSKAPADRTPVKPLCTAKWDQGFPYNSLCPTMYGRHTYTGCVATAMAQVMKYHEWPLQGTGSVSYVDDKGAKREMDLNVAFDWDNMLDTYNEDATDEQKKAVAQLMVAAGHSVKMMYGTDASGAVDNNIPYALRTYFDYEKDAQILMRSHYGLADWENIIYTNLKEYGPVVYCGSSHLGGHAFVCDGYSKDGYFHFNWGWSGMYDGYYHLTALNPEGQGIGGYAGGYNIAQTAVVNIRKNAGATSVPEARMAQVNGAVSCLTNTGSYVTVKGTWANLDALTKKFYIALRLENVDNPSNVEYVKSPYGLVSIESNMGVSDLKFQSKLIPEGNWKCQIVTKDNFFGDKAEWLTCMHSINEPDVFYLKNEGGKLSATNQSALSLKVTNVELLTDLYYGYSAKMKFTVTNNSDSEVAQIVAPCLISGSSLVGMAGGVFFDLMPGESAEKELVFDMMFVEGFKVNTNYQMCLFDLESGLVLYQLGMKKVLPIPSDTELSASSFTLEGGNHAEYRDNIVFNATVNCVGGYYGGPLTVVIADGNKIMSNGNSSDVLFISKGETASTEFHLSFANAGAKQYTALLGYLKSNGYAWIDNFLFTIGTSGVENVACDGGESLNIAYERSMNQVFVTASSDVKFVKVFAVDGSELCAGANLNGNVATVDMSQFESRVVIIAAGDASGAVRTIKVAL